MYYKLGNGQMAARNMYYDARSIHYTYFVVEQLWLLGALVIKQIVDLEGEVVEDQLGDVVQVAVEALLHQVQPVLFIPSTKVINVSFQYFSTLINNCFTYLFPFFSMQIYALSQPILAPHPNVTSHHF